MRRWVLTAVVAALAAFPTSALAASRDTYLGCGSSDSWSVGAHPRSCLLAWPDLDHIQSIDLRRVAWSRWGGAAASGTAVYRFKAYDPYTRVRVRAFDRRFCGAYHLYTRVRVSFAGGRRHVWRAMGCAYFGNHVPAGYAMCDNPFRTYELVAVHEVSCAEGRRVAKAYQAVADGGSPQVVGPWTCTYVAGSGGTYWGQFGTRSHCHDGSRGIEIYQRGE